MDPLESQNVLLENKSKSFKLLITILFLVLLGIGGFYYYKSNNNIMSSNQSKSVEDASIDSHSYQALRKVAENYVSLMMSRNYKDVYELFCSKNKQENTLEKYEAGFKKLYDGFTRMTKIDVLDEEKFLSENKLTSLEGFKTLNKAWVPTRVFITINPSKNVPKDAVTFGDTPTESMETTMRQTMGAIYENGKWCIDMSF